jgi:hypothetical protein
VPGEQQGQVSRLVRLRSPERRSRQPERLPRLRIARANYCSVLGDISEFAGAAAAGSTDTGADGVAAGVAGGGEASVGVAATLKRIAVPLALALPQLKAVT